MTFRNQKTLGAVGLALALALSAGFASQSDACGGDGKKASIKATSSKATTTASSDGCAATKHASMDKASAAGACGAKAKATQTASGCCPSKGKAMQTAQATLPDGTQMTRVDVEGGIDLVFTSKDLAGVENFLNTNMQTCLEMSGKNGKAACGETCKVSRTEENVTLSIRGGNAETCAANWMQTAALTDEAEKADGAKTGKKI